MFSIQLAIPPFTLGLHGFPKPFVPGTNNPVSNTARVSDGRRRKDQGKWLHNARGEAERPKLLCNAVGWVPVVSWTGAFDVPNGSGCGGLYIYISFMLTF